MNRDRYKVFTVCDPLLSRALYFIERGINRYAAEGYRVTHLNQGFTFGEGWWYGILMELEAPTEGSAVK
jgi:hypothetical protein